jgi:uncharacterized protein YaiL (DUF2058 family)
MGNMRDAFKKANLISGKDAKRLAHEERVHRSQVGREGVEQEQEQRRKELEEAQRQEREQTRERQEQLESQRKAEAELSACLELLASEAKRPAPGARTRFYFETEDGRIPSLEVSETDLRQLQAGELSIVSLTERDAHVYGLIATAHARRIAQVLPGRVVRAPRGVVRR